MACPAEREEEKNGVHNHRHMCSLSLQHLSFHHTKDELQDNAMKTLMLLAKAGSEERAVSADYEASDTSQYSTLHIRKLAVRALRLYECKYEWRC